MKGTVRGLKNLGCAGSLVYNCTFEPCRHPQRPSNSLVKVSKWATPVVKKNGTVRVCGDYKVTANRALLTEEYPLPKVDDLISALSGGKCLICLTLTCSFP